MDGKIAEVALEMDRRPRSIASYERQGGSAERSETAIDETTEEQLRGLGYLE